MDQQHGMSQFGSHYASIEHRIFKTTFHQCFNFWKLKSKNLFCLWSEINDIRVTRPDMEIMDHGPDIYGFSTNKNREFL
jgi:Holliday junction resolvasome RuvABC DNA-binding subunit